MTKDQAQALETIKTELKKDEPPEAAKLIDAVFLLGGAVLDLVVAGTAALNKYAKG